MKRSCDSDDSLCGVDETVIRREKAKARDLRKTRWWRQKIGSGRCHYCGKVVPPAQLTMDHVVPLARGGQSVKGNIVACCKDCNSKKKSMPFFEWQEYLEKLSQEAL